MKLFNLFFLGIILISSCGNSPNLSEQTENEISKKDKNFFTRVWNTFKTDLTKEMKSPQYYEDFESEKDNIKLVEYLSGESKLKGLINTTNIEEGKKKPAIVYLHGGFALGYSDVTDCQAFTDAGYIVFAPSYRGENGNDGNYELLMGEIDDAKAAIKWLQKQPYIDADKISVFGHSIGGSMALSISLHSDINIYKCGGSSGAYPYQLFEYWAVNETVEVPFDYNDDKEVIMRLPLMHLEHMVRPHHLYLGVDDGHDDIIKENIEPLYPKYKEETKLKIYPVEGDHFTSLAPAMNLFLKELEK